MYIVAKSEKKPPMSRRRWSGIFPHAEMGRRVGRSSARESTDRQTGRLKTIGHKNESGFRGAGVAARLRGAHVRCRSV